MEVIYSINGKYFKAFGVYISESKGLLDKLKPKSRKSYDWAEYHGKVVDLSAPKYEEREITLTGWIEGENWQTMKQNFDALLSEFDKGGLVRLLVEFGKELVYDVYLDSAVELEKSFKEGEIIGKFILKLKEPNPVKKVLRLVGNNLSLSFNSEDWVDVNVDGTLSTHRGGISINKVLQYRDLMVNEEGHNLLKNTSFKNNAEHWHKGSPSAEFSITDRSARVSHTLNTYNEIHQIVPCEPNTEYCVSAMVKGNGIARIFMLEKKGSGNTNIYKDHFHSFNLTNEYQRVSFTFRTQPDADKFYAIFRVIENYTAYFKDLKIEKGNKPTDWTPAPEETHYITIAGNIDKIKNLQTNAEELW